MVINTTLTSPLLEKLGLKWADCYRPESIATIDKAFLNDLQHQDQHLYERLITYRQLPNMDDKDQSWLLIDVSIAVENFIAKLLNIEESVKEAQSLAKNYLPLYEFKKEIVQKRVKKRKKEAAALAHRFLELDHQLQAILEQYTIETNLAQELQLALLVNHFLQDEETYQEQLELITQWCLAATVNGDAQAIVKDWWVFKTPQKLDFDNLVAVESIAFHGAKAYESKPELLRQREGFSLTDQGLAPLPVMDEAQYCVYCHKNGTDYCSKGFLIKKTDPSLGFKKDPHGGLLVGCPLKEKISEMNWLYHIGQIIAPLVMIMLDNPMCPATGYRICNDCMKACIYQKQKPVDIPAVETDSLKRVLALPWGVEIYWLLTLWSPLSTKQIIPQAFHNRKILVMGMGPAGFTLSHYLLRAGYAVVGMDGLKITPLQREQWLTPIKSYATLEQDLDERQVMGFGGVAEYGITSRWNKNFLSLIYLSLVRQPHFQCFGSVRFGGTMTIERAWELGFDHLAIAVGAGLPKELPIENSMVNGMRQANDFLMALQLTGASKQESLANLQIRLPAVIIGGGLTGVDAATECQAYYLRQIEKTSHRYHSLCELMGEASLRSQFSNYDLVILDEQLEHAKALAVEKYLAAKENRQPNVIKLIRQWGGVSIVYRKAMQQSPAYRLNHEELQKAMEEGLYYVPHMQPVKVEVDKYNHAKALVCESTQHDHAEQITIPAKTLLVATGAKPNVAYAFEHRGVLEKENMQYKRFQSINNQLKQIEVENHCKSDQIGMFTNYDQNNKRVSFLGDTHPTFHGSVVKAIASAKQAFESIDALFEKTKADDEVYQQFARQIQAQMQSYLVSKQWLKNDVLELIVHAPEARQHYQPGVIYKLQTYDKTAVAFDDLQAQSSESIALGASLVENEPDQLRFFNAGTRH